MELDLELPDRLVDLAPWIALGAGVALLLVLAWSGLRAWRAWTRTRDTKDAATALVDLHVDRVEQTLDRITAHAAETGECGAELGAAVDELRAEVDHLRWLVGRIPAGRDQLRRELLDLVLPTSPLGKRDGG